MEEAMQTERDLDLKFGNQWKLKLSMHQHKQTVEKLREEIKAFTFRESRLINDWIMRGKIWDPLTGHRERTKEEIDAEMKEIAAGKGPLEAELKGKLADLKRIQARLELREKVNKTTAQYFADLRKCWDRIRQVQLLEYQKLGLDVSGLLPKGRSVELQTVKGIVNSALVNCEGLWFPRVESKVEEWVKKEVTRGTQEEKRKRESSQNSRTGGQLGGKPEGHGWWRLPGFSRADPEQLSARRGPPTDRPPDKPPPCKGAVRGSLIERAGSPYASQLASFSCGIHGLSGTPAHLESIQNIVQSPSNYPASSQAGSSPSQVPDDNDECAAGCTRVAAGSGSTG
jgi:hypothetical protein